jgi:hypothetical protein
MNEAAQQKAFDAEVKAQAKKRNAIQNKTAAEVVALLKKAYAQVDKKLKDQPTEYQQWHLPQVKNSIKAALAEFGEAAGVVGGDGQDHAWEAGLELQTAPLEKAGLHIKGLLPKIDVEQLKAMQHFMTGIMKDVGAQAVQRINGHLGMMIAGAQDMEATIQGIQDSHSMARKRATTIVRTEVGRAYAIAGQLRAEQAASKVPGLQKQWRRSGKIHSRKNHDFADGQIRPVDKPFIMGTGAVVEGHEGNGARLMHPHDPKAPAKETVNCGCISLPYMDKWAKAGALKDPGKRAFTDEEIALNPAKADYAEMEAGPTMEEIFAAQDKAKAAAKTKRALKGIAKEQGQAELDRLIAAADAKAAGFKLQEALAGKLGTYYKQAAKQLSKSEGKSLDELAAELQAKAKQNSALAAYKKSVLAGKKPTKAQALAFSKLEAEEQAAIQAELNAALDKQVAAVDLAGSGTRTAADVDRLTVTDVGHWKQVGPQAGSNPGGLFEDVDGTKFYVKFPADEARARNEVLAGKLYKLVGVDTPELSLVAKEGKLGVASRIVDGLAKDKSALTAGGVGGVSEGFGADAWLGNWDVVGMGYDNLLVKGGRAWRVDTGGALLFRAQGGAKGAAFGSNVTELASLRDAQLNAQAADVFGKLTEPQIKASVARVLATNDDAIRQIVTQYGPGTLEERSALGDLLLARKASMAKLYPDVSAKIAEARKLAVEQAQGEIRSQVAALDEDILTAIKGIASRAAKGATLEEKDIARVASAASRYDALLKSGESALFDSSADSLKSHYGAWLERLQTAIAKGVGAKAEWAVSDSFAGIKTAAVDVNPAKVKPAFAPFLFGEGPMFSGADVKATLSAVERHFGKGEYLAKSKVPANNADAAAFDKMPAEYKRALWSWTPSHIYSDVNRELVAAANGGKEASAAVREYQRLLNDAITNAPESRKFKGKSARGMFNSRAEAEAFYKRLLAVKKSKGTFTFDGFASSTVGDTPGFSGKELWIHINGKSGVHINSISAVPGTENEVLFGTETPFRINKTWIADGKFHVEITEE